MSVDKRGSSLLEAFRVSINQHRCDAKLSCLTAAESEQLLWLWCDAVPFEVSIFEANKASSASSSTAAAAAVYCCWQHRWHRR
eukprot:6202252-Pleurochrysis_carterae.AAC.1